MDRMIVALSPLEHGWYDRDGAYVAKWMELSAAPRSAFCGCRKTSCESSRCSCKSAGLRCTVSCRCVGCMNDMDEEYVGEHYDDNA